MLRQLNQLQKEMYVGYHTLDTLRCRAPHGHDHYRAVAAGRSFTTSRFNPAKRLRPRGGSSSSQHERAIQVLGDLDTTIRDVRELVVFLSGCPRLCRQPYTVHLLVDKCMFNRQMEMEKIMEFLLRSGTEEDEEAPAVLPIIGPGRVGKTTMIEHACNDQRVRSHFSQILRFSQDGTTDTKAIAMLGDCSVIRLDGDDDRGGEKMTTLVIIEVAGDIDEGVWEKLYSDCRHQTGRGSKILVASRSDKIARFGRATQTQALTVRFFTEEAYWFFFKARTFGSTDMKGCFFGSVEEDDSGPRGEDPQLSIIDLFFGENDVRPCGRFNVLAYSSHRYSYMMTCEVQRQHHEFSRKKRIIQHVAS
nr:unnamed protein product [Digitaria exilis]